MNKKAFLYQLKKGLKGIPKYDLEDILYDYREHIDAALEMGKSEEDITEELGSPRKIAKQHRAEFYISQAVTKKTPGSVMRAITAGIGLSFFNIIFVLPIMISVYVALIVIFFSFITVAVVGIAVVIGGIVFMGFIPALAFVFIGISILCLGILLTIAMLLLIKIITIGFISYFKANIGIVRRKEGV